MKTRDAEKLRNYGLGNSGQPIGSPIWEIGREEDICPNCGARLARITVRMKHPLVVGGKGTGHYSGCPACPYASPCAIVADIADSEKKS